MPLISDDLATVRIIGTVLITIFGAIGCSAPLAVTLIARRQPKIMRYLSFVQLALTALGAGVVISTALVHILPDGMEMLEKGGLGEEEHAHGDVVDVVNTTALSYNKNFTTTTTTIAPTAASPKLHRFRARSNIKLRETEDEGDDDDDSEPYPYGPMLMMVGMLVTYVVDSELHKLADAQQGATMKAHVTELGIAVHSVLVGVAYGAMTSLDSLNTLSIALMLHQLCEGFAMGPVIFKGARSTLHAIVLIAIFTFSLPIGIGVGAIALQYGDPGSKQANLSQGILSCLAAGMLMYVGAVEFLGGLQRATDGHDHGHSHTSPSHSQTDTVNVTVNSQLLDEQHSVGPLLPTTGGGAYGGFDDEGGSRATTQGHGATTTPEATFLTDYPLVGRFVSHTMVLLGAALMAVVAIYA